jgi:mRNA-degrading endonuclease YafQ of YafQ-DinJ toxin-antitoxin module
MRKVVKELKREKRLARSEALKHKSKAEQLEQVVKLLGRQIPVDANQTDATPTISDRSPFNG